MDSTGTNISGENSENSKMKRSSTTKPKPVYPVAALSKAFQTYGPQHPDEIAKALQGVQLPDGSLETYVNNFAILSEELVLEQMQENTEFVQCASWSELLASNGFRETCNNELPLALRTIANTEIFPEYTKGVDFKLLYLNLASMMMGQPVRHMNEATQRVLRQAYEDTVSKLSKADQTEDYALLQQRLKSMRKPTPSENKTGTITDLKEFFADPNINPFQIPFDKICRNPS